VAVAVAVATSLTATTHATAATPGWGGYNGLSTTEDTAFALMVKDTPNYANSYYTSNRTTVAKVEFDRVAKGITPNISVATKNLNGCATCFMLWANIAAGKYDAFWRAWGQSLAKLNHRVLFTFDQEPDARLNHHMIPAQNPSDYARAYRRIHNLIEPLAPKVEWSFWVGGSDKVKVTAMYPGDAYIDRIGWDPYKWSWHPASETPLQTWSGFAKWLNGQSWGQGKPRALFETGIDVKHFGQANAAYWWSLAPAAARTLGLQFFVLYNRVQWCISGYTQVISAYSTAMRSL
jgi:hypothetical protein